MRTPSMADRVAASGLSRRSWASVLLGASGQAKIGYGLAGVNASNRQG